jgi:hypothetical protein
MGLLQALIETPNLIKVRNEEIDHVSKSPDQ